MYEIHEYVYEIHLLPPILYNPPHPSSTSPTGNADPRSQKTQTLAHRKRRPSPTENADPRPQKTTPYASPA